MQSGIGGSAATMSVPDLDDSIVEIDLDGLIQTRGMNPREQILNEFFGRSKSFALAELRKTLRRAAEDIRVRGVYLNLRNPIASFSTMQELRRSLLAFRESEKPLYINIYSGSTLSYFLASAGSQINLALLVLDNRDGTN